MHRAAIYCRLSEEDRNKQCQSDDSNSIQNQKTMLHQYALQNNWEVFHIYSDDNYTGSDRNRPQFRQLLQDAQQRKFDIILCKTQSRFTRELELVERYIHGLFPLWGIRFISVVDNADTANKGNKKSRQINGLVNEWYLEDMSENIRSVLTSRRQNGFHIGAFALYGYQKDPMQKGRLVIDEEAAAVVREVFARFAQGYGKTAIARLLNDRGVPNPTEYKRQKGLKYKQPKSKAGTLWKYSAISDMLVNELYIGNMVQGKYGSVSYKTKQNRPRPKEEWYRVENTHEPIIDRALWDRVQTLIQARAKPFSSGTVGLFARKVRCAHCGYVMRSLKSHGRYYLTCPTRHAAKDACTGAFISAEKLEKLVIAELERLSSLYLNQDELEKKIQFPCVSPEKQKEKLLKDISAYNTQIELYSKSLRELYLDKMRGIVTENDYIALSGSFAAEKERIEQALFCFRQHLEKLDEREGSSRAPHAQLERYLHPDRLEREMVETLIDHIIVGKRMVGTQDIPVEIHWNF